MTDPTYDAGGPVAPATDGGGLAGAFGPEAVAAVLSIVVVVALLGSRLAFAGAGGPAPDAEPVGRGDRRADPDGSGHRSGRDRYAAVRRRQPDRISPA